MPSAGCLVAFLVGCTVAASRAGTETSSAVAVNGVASAAAPGAPRRLLSAPATLGSPSGARALTYSDTSTLTLNYADGTTSGPLPHSESLFGIPAYGGGVQARVYYPTDARDGCKVTADPPANFPTPFIMLLDRGGLGCTFTMKVLNAQRVGAVGVIVADTGGLCPRPGTSDPFTPECPRVACNQCPLYASSPNCACSLPMMADDGSGASVNIPSMMISKAAGDAIKAHLVDTSPKGGATAAMRWDIPNNDGQVEYTLWADSNDYIATVFRQAFVPYVPFLGPSALFTPHYYIIDGRSQKCDGAFDCHTQCINGGYYCSLDPDGDLDAGISGADVVLENLRQVCVWQTVSTTYTKDYGIKWWRYADAFAKNCNVPTTWNAKCSEAQMSTLGIDVNAVRSCVSASNDTAAKSALTPASSPKDWTNTLLQMEINLRVEMDVRILPAATVEGVMLAGGMSPSGVLKAICAGYALGTSPPVCACTDAPVATLDKCVATAAGNGDRMPSWVAALIVVGVLGSVLSIGAAYYFYRRAKLETEEMLDDYRALMSGPEGDGVASGAGSPRLGRRYPPPPGAWSNGLKEARDFPRAPAPEGVLERFLHSIVTPPPPGSVASWGGGAGLVHSSSAGRGAGGAPVGYADIADDEPRFVAVRAASEVTAVRLPALPPPLPGAAGAGEAAGEAAGRVGADVEAVPSAEAAAADRDFRAVTSP